VFGVNQFAVDVDVEYASAAFYQNGLYRESVFQFGSQTDRLGFIVSLHAIGDRGFHVFAFIDRA
jgi:hypothetical protein